jgi:tetratricopeptide (TPR) repeat protein
MPRKNYTAQSNKPTSPSSTGAVRSGGIDISADEVQIGGDVVGRDKITVQQTIMPYAEPTPQFVLPFARNKAFVGRIDDLKRLHAVLHKHQTNGSQPVMLSGMGGVGKTQLAVEYAWRYRKNYPDGVYWVNASLNLKDELARLASDIGIQADSIDKQARNEILASGFCKFLRAHSRALVVFDNVDDPRILRAPIAGNALLDLPCHILLTTRRRDTDLAMELFEVQVLSDLAALELLLGTNTRRHILSKPRSSELKTARNICKLLGYLPLALALAAAYLGKNDAVSLSDFCRRLEKDGGLSVVDTLGMNYLDLPTQHQAVIEATLMIQWEAIKSIDAQRILQAAALGEEETALSDLNLVVLTGLANKSRNGYPAPLSVGLADLQEWSLIERPSSQDGIRLHPLVRNFVTKITGGRRALVDACFDGIIATLNSPLHLDLEVADRAVQMLLDMAYVYRQEFSDAYQGVLCYRQALATAHEVKNDSIEDARWKLGDAYYELGKHYSRSGNVRSAIDCYERYFVILEQGSGNWTEGDVLDALAETYITTGELSEAISCYHSLTTFLSEVKNAEPPEVNPLEWKIGLLYEEIGDLDNAKRQFEYCTKFEQEYLDFYEAELPEAREHSKHLEQLLIKMKKQKIKRRK